MTHKITNEVRTDKSASLYYSLFILPLSTFWWLGFTLMDAEAQPYNPFHPSILFVYSAIVALAAYIKYRLTGKHPMADMDAIGILGSILLLGAWATDAFFWDWSDAMTYFILITIVSGLHGAMEAPMLWAYGAIEVDWWDFRVWTFLIVTIATLSIRVMTLNQGDKQRSRYDTPLQ